LTIVAAAMVAFTCVASSTMVLWATLLKLSTEPLTKLVPVTVSSNGGSPAVALAGARLTVVGSRLFTVKVNAGVEVPPPGAGLVTVTDLAPAKAISDVAMTALTCVASTTKTSDV
jgi:hypothetical protein